MRKDKHRIDRNGVRQPKNVFILATFLWALVTASTTWLVCLNYVLIAINMEIPRCTLGRRKKPRLIYNMFNSGAKPRSMWGFSTPSENILRAPGSRLRRFVEEVLVEHVQISLGWFTNKYHRNIMLAGSSCMQIGMNEGLGQNLRESYYKRRPGWDCHILLGKYHLINVQPKSALQGRLIRLLVR